jgi:hypothetical protein
MRLLILCLAVFAAACSDDANAVDADTTDAPTPTGTISMMWSVTNSVDSSTITCDDANAQNLVVTLVKQGEAGGTTEVFGCSNLMGTTRPIEIGTYALTFTLRGPDGDVATAPAVGGIEVTRDSNTPLANPIEFEVLARGDLTFTIDATATGDNCGLMAMMGAEIDLVDGITIELFKGATCVPATYTLTNGPPAMYTGTCPTPTNGACVENDQMISVTGLVSGSYRLQITGRYLGTACWTGERTFRVPTDDGTVTTDVGLSYMTMTGCP